MGRCFTSILVTEFPPDEDPNFQDDNDQIDRLLIMQRLRDQKTGCPWDKEADIATKLRLTTTYEVLDAIAMACDLRGEQGDLYSVVLILHNGSGEGALTLWR